MKKILLFICLLLMCGCGSEKTDVNDVSVKPDTETEITKENNNNEQDNQNAVDIETFKNYVFYVGIKEDGKRWYINIPYLNEVNLGEVYLLANSDDWWLTIVRGIASEECTLEEAKDAVFEMYFRGMEGYFVVDDNGFVESSSNNEIHSGLDMIKVEGSATHGKYSVIGECWVYGYIFTLSGKPCGLIAMNNKDKSEESKETMRMYLDAMVDTLVLK